ncbi:MAG: restriction endonuclease subunit M [Clostridia bacterium]
MDEIQIDVKENSILKMDPQLLAILLKDRTTNQNIIWATDNYEHKGFGYKSADCMTADKVSGRNGLVIKPRVEKSKKEQTSRVRDKAEVFTPSWICNAQNNLVDEAWFERNNVFNIEKEKSWETIVGLIKFPKDKTWQDYVKSNRLEITCGEAPYLVSRYDTVSGDIIPINNRIGLLDRKLRIVNENTDENEWFEWSKASFKSIYGYDWQGDNVLLARENLFLTFVDYYKQRFYKEPSLTQLIEIAEIISWNIWQMDGLKFVVPNSCIPAIEEQLSIFDSETRLEENVGRKTNNNKKSEGIYCKIKDWEKNKTIKFKSLLERGWK